MTTTELTIICDEVVDACAPWSAIVRAGQTLQIIDLHGNQAVDTLLYGVSGDQVDHTLRYSAQATVATQRNIFLSTGSVLRAANGTPLMTIVADDVGNHDTIADHGAHAATTSSQMMRGSVVVIQMPHWFVLRPKCFRC